MPNLLAFLGHAADFLTVLVPLVLLALYVMRQEGNQRVLASRLDGVENWLGKIDEKVDQLLISIAFPVRARGGKKLDD